MKTSVVMAVYNGALFVEKQLMSILKQTISPNQIIIVNDASIDSSLTIINSIIEKQSKEIDVKIITNEFNLGVVKSFFKGIDYAEGDVIFLADQDDIWNKNKISRCLRMFEKDRKIDVVATAYQIIDSDGKIKSTTKYPLNKSQLVNSKKILYNNIFPGCTLCFRKDYKKYFKNYNENIYIHDWYLLLIAALNGKLYFLNESLFYYRLHENNTIGLNKTLAPKYQLNERLKNLENKIYLYKYLIQIINNEAFIKPIKFNEKRLVLLQTKSWPLFIKLNLNGFNCYSLRQRVGDIVFLMK